MTHQGLKGSFVKSVPFCLLCCPVYLWVILTKLFLQSGGELENGEKIANKLMKLVRIAIKIPTTDDKGANFKRITGDIVSAKLLVSEFGSFLITVKCLTPDGLNNLS